ncbi:MAG: hypothetical protein A2V93_04140 [Ignavibacteria bacterium RBG_16_34_14]|nr:MAG: hypothetical protein A2V93_04140 [Ignavibacteria bacterium RBG_16_34_14]
MKAKELKRDFLRTIGNFLIDKAVNLLCKSLKVEIRNKESIDQLRKENKNFIIAFWHGTMLLPWYLHRNERVAALISKSKDGDLLAKLLRKWNYQVIRGSSSSGGDIALSIMVDYAKNNSSIAITPDGPRGPAKKMKAGAVITAKKSGLPLILVGTGYIKKRVLKNWDKFQIPAFFTKAKIFYSAPIYVNQDLDYNSTSEMINICEQKLNELQAEAERF